MMLLRSLPRNFVLLSTPTLPPADQRQQAMSAPDEANGAEEQVGGNGPEEHEHVSPALGPLGGSPRFRSTREGLPIFQFRQDLIGAFAWLLADQIKPEL